MKKSLLNNDVFYTIVWTRIYQYDKYRIGGIPELPGIICLLQKIPNGSPKYLIFYSCWRDGLRNGIKNFLNPSLTRFPEIIKNIDEKTLLYKYTIIDSKSQDLKDVMFWLIKEYQPVFNSLVDFEDSKRYKNIYLKEMIIMDTEH
ncbi:MAG: hypothetical protein SVZ03_12110 [Spirochaetota bacterium]|nr:hypothetical protein [Spirochaetota bacterium]